MWQKIKSTLSDIRVWWALTPMLGNFIILPLLIFPFLAPRRQQVDLRITAFIWTGLLFFGWTALRGLLALPDPGLDSVLSRIFPILFFALVFLFRDPTRDDFFRSHVFIWTTIAVLGLCLINRHVFGVLRAELFTGNALLLAAAILPLIYVNLYFAANSDGAKKYLHYIAALCAVYIIGAFTASRMGILTVLSIGCIHICFQIVHLETMFKKIRYTMVIMASTGVAVWGLLTFGRFADRLAVVAKWMAGQQGALDSSGSQRLEMWKAAWEAVSHNPLFGHGPQNMFEAIKPYLSPDYAHLDYNHTHNFILNLGVGGGLISIVLGLVFIFSAVLMSIYLNQHRARNFELYVQGAMAVFVFGLANYALFEGYMAIVTCLMIAGPVFLEKTKGG